MKIEAKCWKLSGGFVSNWDLFQKVAGLHSYLSYFTFAKWIFFSLEVFFHCTLAECVMCPALISFSTVIHVSFQGHTLTCMYVCVSMWICV